MENWRENLSIISRLRVAGNRTDTLATRLFFERLFTGANFHPAGVSQRAVVCIKKLKSPPVKDKLHGFAGGNLALEWEIGIRREVEKLFHRAFHPIREAVPAEAESVIFEDKAELLACLAQDWRRGALAEHWWWSALFPNLDGAQTVFKIWLAAAEFTPFALQVLSKTGAAENFVKRLQPPEADELLQAIIQIFGLRRLQAVLSAPSAENARKASRSFLEPDGKSRFPGEEKLAVSARPDKFIDLIVPESKNADLSFGQVLLLETGLLLARSPRAARSVEFAERVRISRFENEFRKTIAAKKSAENFAVRQAFEAGIISGKKTNRRLSNESAAQIAQPPRAEAEPPIFDAPENGGEKPSEKTAGRSVKTPEPAERPARDTKKTGAVKRPAKMDFESVETEKDFDKITRKARKSDQKVFKPSPAEEIFESFFEDPETARETDFQTNFGGVFYLLNLGLYLGLYRDFTESLTTEIDLPIWDFVALLGFEFLGERIKKDAVWEFLKHAAERGGDREFGREFNFSQDWRMSPEWLETFAEDREWRGARTKTRLVVRHADGFNVLDVRRRGDADTQLKNELEVYQNRFSRLVKAEKKDLPPVKSKGWLENLAEYLQKRLLQALNLRTPEELNAILFERRATVSVSATHLEITFALADLPIEVRLAGIDRNPAWIPAAGKFVYFHFV